MVFGAILVKRLEQAKSRLRVNNRSELTLGMLRHVLAVAIEADVFSQIAVVSPDPVVLELAESHRVRGLRQETGTLNDACAQAAAWARGEGADGLLLAHADLPELTVLEIRQIVARARNAPPPRVVLAPDRHGMGTNVLVAMPPDAIPFAFGPASRARHLDLAHRHGAKVEEFVSRGTAADIDTADDLAESILAVEAASLVRKVMG